MLTKEEFLEAVLAPEGKYCVVGIHGKGIHSQKFFDTYTEVAAAVEALEAEQINAFIALASYNTGASRTAANVRYLKCFYLDLDIGGSEKKYPTQHDAIVALKEFVRTMGLPRPMLVNSGNGVHVYWVLDNPVERQKWKVVADRLKAACIMSGLKIDPTVTGDAARILRAVGSSNWKNPDNPLPVTALNTCQSVSLEQFSARLGVTQAMLDGAGVERPMDDATKALLDSKPSSFKLILKKSIEGKGCNQILQAVQHQESMTEPMWRAALSIAQFCKDRAKAIHVISENHPDYSFDETEEKASRIQGPYRCDKFWAENPDGCKGCRYQGKITSPIVIGKGEIEIADPEDNVLLNPDPVAPQASFTIPEYPFPFARGKHGGIVVRSKDEDGNPADEIIYENDLYLVNTVDDPYQGMAGLFRLHLPQDGVREFLIPLKEMVAKEAFSKRMAEQGVSTIGKQMESLMAYSSMSVKKYQASHRAARSRVQFGWADNFTSFIVGDRQITKDEVIYSPPSSVTLPMISAFGKKGSLEEWKKLVQLYNRPGFELYMFGLFVAFGSPLVPFLSEKCGIINYFSSESGTGKTTILRMVNSVFGHPDEVMLIKDDTMNSRMNRVGVMQNITPTVDEITNETPEVTSNFIYQFLHGRGKHRLQGSLNVERSNTVTWKTIGLLTGNASLEDNLHAKKRAPEGELARLIEIRLQPIRGMPKMESDALFAPLKFNYGMACEPYLQFVLRYPDLVHKTIGETQLLVDRKGRFSQRERFQSSTLTGGLSGGILARQAGVLDLSDQDIRRVFHVICDDVSNKVDQKNAEPSVYGTMVGAYLSEHNNDILVINSGVIRKGPAEAPIKEPRGKLLIRYEPDVEKLYLSKPAFRRFCAEGQVSYDGVISHLKRAGVFIEERKMRMGKGLHISEAEIAIVLKHPKEDFFNADARSTDSD